MIRRLASLASSTGIACVPVSANEVGVSWLGDAPAAKTGVSWGVPFPRGARC